VVEPLGQVAGQLQVLPLVLADRHLVRLVEQDVGRLQDRVGEQPDLAWSAPPLADLSLNWVIRLASPNPVRQPSTQASSVCSAPGSARTGCTAPGRARREQLRGRDPGALAQRLRVMRHGDRVQVDHAVDRVPAVLQVHPLPDRTQVVAQVEGVSGRLDAGEDARGEWSWARSFGAPGR
jgi:hypothetical protein